MENNFTQIPVICRHKNLIKDEYAWPTRLACAPAIGQQIVDDKGNLATIVKIFHIGANKACPYPYLQLILE